jgi:phosphatidylinositol 4-kinase A
MDAHQFMARNMEEVSPYREILLTEILNALIEFWASQLDTSQTPDPLLPKYFETVAAVLPEPRFEGLPTYDQETVTAFRNMWFACVIHGVHPNSTWVRAHAQVLRKVAANSPLLTLETATNDFDSDLELNPVLNRMKDIKHSSLRILEEELTKQLPSHQSELKNFDLPKLVFIGAVTLVETLRSENGKCSLVLDYFDDPNLEKSDASSIFKAIVENINRTFLESLRVNSFETAGVSLGQRELKELLIRCCDPVSTVQNLAQICCDRLISAFPALLCFEGTTYVLLELLTLLWQGCLSQETDLVGTLITSLTQYSPKFEFRSSLTGTQIELRDSSQTRERLLDSFHLSARKWLLVALQKSPDDMRMVLQSYLAELDESAQFSQHAPGRQLALEIGRSMPSNDSKSGWSSSFLSNS